jgi:hypothetical protein
VSQSSTVRPWVLALIGSMLMFAGWVLAIVPAFHDLHRVALVVGVAVVGFGLVLIPAGVDFLGNQTAGKRGPRAIIVSMLPSVVLFFITVAVLPLSAIFRVLATICEIGGMAIYGGAWGVYPRGSSSASPQSSSRRV